MTEATKTAQVSALEPKTKLTGKVVKTTLAGVLVDIGQELPGVIHISQLQKEQVNKPEDVFTFSTPDVVEQDMAADAEFDMTNIKVVPNPYLNSSLYEPDQFDRRIKFTNLPYECTIKVFNLAGDHVVTLEKEASDDSYYTWNMLTQHGLPLASGLYIYIVTAPDGGEYVGKMAIFTEVEQLDTF